MQAFYSRNPDFDNVAALIPHSHSAVENLGLLPGFATCGWRSRSWKASKRSVPEDASTRRAETGADITPRRSDLKLLLPRRVAARRWILGLEDEFQTQLDSAIASGAKNRVHRGHIRRLAAATELTRYRWV